LLLLGQVLSDRAVYSFNYLADFDK